jgi:hypothetical protein
MYSYIIILLYNRQCCALIMNSQITILNRNEKMFFGTVGVRDCSKIAVLFVQNLSRPLPISSGAKAKLSLVESVRNTS